VDLTVSKRTFSNHDIEASFAEGDSDIVRLERHRA